MDTALMVIGLVAVGIIIVWIFSFLSDPKEINETEEAQVRQESPQERERAKFDEAAKNAESNADDIAFYSPGDSDGE